MGSEAKGSKDTKADLERGRRRASSGGASAGRVREPSEGARRAALRRPDYNEASPREQWEDDKALGILDWDGD